MANIQGTSGNDSLSGTTGNDQIYGYAGNDTLIGGGGNDYLVGGSGNDNLTGGSGRDTFVLNYSGGGIDRITDFSVSNDIIKVTTSTIGASKYLIGTRSSLSNYEVIEDAAIDAAIGVSKYLTATRSSLSNYEVIEDAAIDSTNFINRSVTLGSSNVSQSANIFTYNASTGALLYLDQQIAWLPPNLNWNGSVVMASRPNNDE